MKHLITIMALCLTVTAEDISFRWNQNPEPTVTSYILDYTKTRVNTNATRAAYSWLMSTVITNRQTNVTVTIPGATLTGGTNYFHLTAVDQSGLVSDLSHAVTAVKPSVVTGGNTVAVTIQSTTNFTMINWETEAVIPVLLSDDEPNKYYRAFLAIKQGIPNGFPTNPPAPPGPLSITVRP